MLNKLLFKLTAGLPCRIIDIDGNPYLERYSLGKWLGVTFYLHRFVGQDSERHVHDHPWKWARALILTGEYIEECVCALDIEQGWISKFIRRRWYNNLDPHVFHRIVGAAPGTWTLFLHGRRFKSWGFLQRVSPLDGRDCPEGVLYYQPYDVRANKGWEKNSPLGCNAERVPL